MALVRWTERLRELVQSGPVPFDVALAEVAAMVPPQRGYRDSEARTNWIRQNRGAEVVKPTEDQKQDLIYRGQHRIAYSTIWTQKRAGWVDVYEVDGVKMVGPGPRIRGE